MWNHTSPLRSACCGCSCLGQVFTSSPPLDGIQIEGGRSVLVQGGSIRPPLGKDISLGGWSMGGSEESEETAGDLGGFSLP